MDTSPSPLPQSTSPKFATMRRRIAASIIDNFLICFLIYIVVYPFFGLDLLSLLTKYSPSYRDILVTQSLKIQLFSIILAFIYQYVFIIHSVGATIGMKILNIKMLRENDQPLGLSTLIIRNIVSIFSGLAMYIGYLWAIFDKKKQTWHDKAAQTIVVETGRPQYGVVVLVIVVTFLIQYGIFALIGMQAFNLSYSQIKSSQLQDTDTRSWKNPEAKKLYEKSMNLFEQMRTNEDNNVDPSINAALSDQNIAILKQALVIEPKNENLWNELTNAYTWQSATYTVDDAIASTKSALELFPQNSTLLENYGVFLVTKGDFENAVIHLKKVIRLVPTPRAFEYLGKAYGRLNLFDESIDAYRSALKEYEKLNKNGEYDKRILSVQKSINAVQMVKSGRGTFTD